MSLSEQVVSDFDRIVSMTDEFGKTAVYTQYETGMTYNVSVIIEQLSYKDIHSEGRSINDNAIVFVSLSFLPTIYDSISIDGEIWKVASYGKNGSGYRLEVSKDDVSTRKHTHGRFR